MMTLLQCQSLTTVPTASAWYLADLSEARGKQELFARQTPQRLKALREHALVESAVSSNRIEGVEVERSRVATIMFGRPLLRDRDEQELRGYRDALNLIHSDSTALPLNEATVRRLHHLVRGGVGDAGEYRLRSSEIIQRYPDGRERVHFRTLAANRVAHATRELTELWHACIRERWVHPLIALAGFNLDFLCIHPFRDGNGRVSRLLLLLQCYHLGYEVGRYVSLERLIEENKDRYYESLEQSSKRWHSREHDCWPYVNFVLYTLKTAYQEFEERVGRMVSPKGAKAEMVLSAIRNAKGEFRLADIHHACPGVGREWIRVLLAKLRESGEVACRGKGPAARWRSLRE